MGIDFTKGGAGDFENSAHWSYSGFNDFRARLAADIGIKLGEMEGFTFITRIGGGIESEPKSWDKVSDLIKPFLDHSDCDGQLSAEECGAIAPRLRELVANWPKQDYDSVKALTLAGNMEECARDGVALIFC